MNFYKDKVNQYETAGAKLDETINRLSTLRLVAFVLSLALIFFLANERMLASLFFVVPLCGIGFGVLINRFNKLSFEKKLVNSLKKINQDELSRLENKLSDFSTGQEFIDRNHDYISDFDVFGPHSLFQLLNRTTTKPAAAMLAKWLSEPAHDAMILSRQNAIRELIPKVEWRQSFQASGMQFTTEKSDYTKLISWIEKPVKLLEKQWTYLAIAFLLSISSTLAVGYFVSGLIYHQEDFSPVFVIPLGISLFINSRFLKRIKPFAEEIIENTQDNIKILGGYESLITTIESEKFNFDQLDDLQSVFTQNNYSAASQIKKLKRILEIFQQKGTKRSIGKNDFYTIFNILWLFDVYLILLTEKWKIKNSPFLKSWISSISEFEVLSSLAGFSYSNPSFIFPEMASAPYTIHFEMLGHPLLNPERRICNDFDLKNRGEIAMITGSNMAGKSTFLRTLGVNLVLALMGAPCCARAAKISNMKIFTSMRTQDNLEEGVSSFYAELKRIEQLLKLIENGEPIFFLLDEMFKGTNSQDRYKGGASLIRQLSELNAFGIISTHDLDLAKITAKHMTISNYSFNSEIQEGEIIFNYKLTNGICTDFNASELMKKSGIKILSDIEQI